MQVIEFLGQARSGKTTQVLLLKKFLEQKGYNVTLSLDRERAKQVHAPVSDCLAFNLIFHSKVIDEYYHAKNTGTIDFFIVDRGFCDVAIWAEVLWKLKQITKEESMSYKNCWKRFRKLVNLTFHFELPLDVLFDRQKKLTTEAVDEVIMNKKWMKTLEEVYQLQKKDFPSCVEIDGLKSIEETKRIIESEIEPLLKKQLLQKELNKYKKINN